MINLVGLKNLESDQRFSDCLYHIKEIVDSQQSIASLLVRLDETLNRDASKAARHLSFLRVEIYGHLLKHIQAARLPLMALLRDTYASLGEEPPPTTDDDAFGA